MTDVIFGRPKLKIENLGPMLKILLAHSDLSLTDADGSTVLHHLAQSCQSGFAMNNTRQQTIIETIRAVNSFKFFWSTKNINNETPAYL